MLLDGYRIILEPAIFYNHYLSRFADHQRAYLQLLHQAFPAINPAHYRGIGRKYLNSYPFYLDEAGQLQEMESPQQYDNMEGRKYIAQLEYSYKSWEEETTGFCFTSRKELDEAWSMMETPQYYEKVYLLRNAPGIDETTLGFDVGRWLSDYS